MRLEYCLNICPTEEECLVIEYNNPQANKNKTFHDTAARISSRQTLLA